MSGCASTAPVRGATVTADTELQILSLTRDRFLELLLSAEDDDAEMVEHLHSAQNRATEKRKRYSAADRERRVSRPQLGISARIETEGAASSVVKPED